MTIRTAPRTITLPSLACLPLDRALAFMTQCATTARRMPASWTGPAAVMHPIMAIDIQLNSTTEEFHEPSTIGWTIATLAFLACLVLGCLHLTHLAH